MTYKQIILKELITLIEEYSSRYILNAYNDIDSLDFTIKTKGKQTEVLFINPDFCEKVELLTVDVMCVIYNTANVRDRTGKTRQPKI